MLPRPRRPSARLILAYLAVTALAFGIISARHSPRERGDGDLAVPTLAGSGGTEQGGRAVQRQLVHAVLRLGLPVLDVYGPGPSLFTPGQLLNTASWFVAGFSPDDPLSLLRLQMPALALAGPEGALEGAGQGSWTPLPLPSIMPDDQRAEIGPSRPLEPGRRPEVIVYQTHAHESFLPVLAAVGVGGNSPYSESTDLNMVRVGEELARTLQEENGIPTVHLRTLFDAGGLTGAYMESEKGVKEAMARYPTARVLIDVHRDSTGREGTVTMIGGKPVARVLVVVGRGNRHLPNPHWESNQAFGRAIARTLDTLFAPDPLPPSFAGTPGQRYPTLVRQLSDGGDDPWTFGRDGRFNQHLSEQAILIEIGGPGNTMTEELRTARMVARAVAAVLGRDRR